MNIARNTLKCIARFLFLFSGIAGIVVATCGIGNADDSRLVVEGVVEAPVADVWRAFTTKEGLQSWMVPHAEIDLKVGGKMLTHYQPDGKIGDPNTIENTILSFDPERMFSIRATKPPERFPFKEAIKEMWSVIYFESVGPRQTRVRVVSMGFRETDESKKMREHFAAGNDWTVKKLQQKFAAETKRQDTAQP